MNILRRTLSLRKRKKYIKDTPEDWQEDERKVREGTCCFQVKYMGCIEVFEPTGLRVCEEAAKLLKTNAKRSERLSFRRKRRGPCPVLALFYITGDSLRVVETKSVWDRRRSALGRDDTQCLIVDQAIEKVSFCAPDRYHLNGFAYICRDGTARRWMCHGFVTINETGDRLSHAVGCAFALCLEKKQKREKEQVVVQFTADRTSFVRQGSFKQTSLTERRADPQSAIIVDPVCPTTAIPQCTSPSTGNAPIERPRPAPDLARQGSFTEFPMLDSTSSAFKRSTSLRLTELPSTLKRQAQDSRDDVTSEDPPPSAGSTQQLEWDPVAAMCQHLTRGLFTLNDDPTLTKSSDIPLAAVPDAAPTASIVTMEAIPKVDTDPWANQQLSGPSIGVPLATRSSPTDAMQPQSSSNPFINVLPSLNVGTNPFLADSSTAAPQFVVNI